MMGLIIVGAVVVVFILYGIRILNEYERGVIFRLGRCIGFKGPGIIYVIPMIDKMAKIGLRTIVLDVPPQDVITRDNVTVEVNAVVYFRVMDPKLAIIEVEDNPYASGYEADEPACYFLKGFIEAVLEYLTDFNRIEYEKLVVIEDTCMSTGAETCTFKITMTYPARSGSQ